MKTWHPATLRHTRLLLWCDVAPSTRLHTARKWRSRHEASLDWRFSHPPSNSRILRATSDMSGLAEANATSMASLLAWGCAGVALGTAMWLAWRPVFCWRLRKIPGPWRLPFLGHLPYIIKEDLNLFIHRTAKEGRHGPVFQIWVGNRPLVVCSDETLMRKMLLRFNVREDFTWLTTLSGDLHKYLTTITLVLKAPQWRIARKAFEAVVMHPRALAKIEPIVHDTLQGLMAGLDVHAQSGEPCNVVGPLNLTTLDITGKVAFGIDLHASEADDPKERLALAKVYDEPQWWNKYPPGSKEFGVALIMALREVFRLFKIDEGSVAKPLGMLLPPLAPAFRQLVQWLPDTGRRLETKAWTAMVSATKTLSDNWHATHAAKGGAQGPKGSSISDSSFLAMLLSGKALADGEVLNETEIIGQVYTMLLAGYETTSTTLSCTLILLSDNLEVQAKAQHEINSVLGGKAPTQEDLERLPYCCAVIDESLRLQSPAFPTRLTTEQVVLPELNITIPKDTLVWCTNYTTQRDPAIWPRAEEFLPERFIKPGNEDVAPSNPLAYMPFGHGGRMCVGYKFALLEARLILVSLLQRFTFAPPPPNCPKPRYRSGLVFAPETAWLQVNQRS